LGHGVERVENGRAVGLAVGEICQADVGVETRLTGGAFLTVEKRGRDVVCVLGGVV
jgi:hypothetical protein